MNYKEQQAMVEALKENVFPWFFLTINKRELLTSNWENVLVRHKNDWQKPWFPYRKLDDGCVVRLSPDFHLPAPAVEAPAGYRIVSMEDRKRCKYPEDCVVVFERYIKGTFCISTDSLGWSSSGLIFAVPSDYVFSEDRVKPSSKFVEYPVYILEDGYFCDVKHICESTSFSLTNIQSIVGFTGDILFRYSDGTEQWRYTLTDRSRDGTPATPIAARFYINGETK